MTKRKMIVFGTLCLMTIGAISYACSDKVLDIDDVEQVSTRAIEEKPANKYYSVLPGTAEWRGLESGEAMFAVCQLSEDQIRDLSTEELVDACVLFPMAYDYILVNDERLATSFAIEHFNGLAELSKRDDGIDALIEKYKKMQYSEGIINISGIDRSFALDLGYIELLLIDKSFFDKMGDEELKELNDAALFRYEEKLNHLNYTIPTEIKRSLLVLAKVRLRIDYSLSSKEKQDIEDFIDNYLFYNEENLENISRILMRTF